MAKLQGRLAASDLSCVASLFGWFLVAIVCLGTLVRALAPPTAGDALCYHLEIPKRFVQLGAVRYLPLDDRSLFPFLMEMLYTLGMLLSGPVLAQLMHWLVGLLFALAAAELATPLVGKRGGLWAATIAMLVPGVTNQMSAPLNDLAVALYTTLMIVAWRRWSETNERRWILLAGVFGGLGLSVKLVAGAMVALVAAALMFQAWRRRGVPAAIACAVTFSLAVSVCCGFWYVRSWVHTGNPVYPYFQAVFGGGEIAKTVRLTPRRFIELPWAATMHPEDFGGRGHQYGAVFLAVLPGLFWLKRGSGIGKLLLLALGFALLWSRFRHDLRFLLPIVPLLAVAVVVAVRGLRELHKPAFIVGSACLAGLLTFQTLIVLKRARPCLAVASGVESREAYLERNEPSYGVARFVNSQLAPGCRLISQDYRGLYFQPEFVREDSLRRRASYRERGDALVDYLAASGFTHVLLVDAYNPATAVYETTLPDRLGAEVARLPLVHATHFEGPDGDRRDYRLLELPRRDPRRRAVAN